ncbi:MAG: hypothetical protein L3J82_10745, partial [Planctomycetes bacterium]|nr:hypothetical protein [Planctomycetota bacterium]
VDFIRGELDDAAKADVRQLLEHDAKAFALFERLQRTFDVLASLPQVNRVSPTSFRSELPLTEPSTAFINTLETEFRTRGWADLVPFIAPNAGWISTLRTEFSVRAVLRSIPMLESGELLIEALRAQFSTRAVLDSIPFIAPAPQWIRALREGFTVRATLGSIPLLEPRPEFVASLREEFSARATVSAIPNLSDDLAQLKRRLKLAMFEEGQKTDAKSTLAASSEEALPTLAASDSFRRRLFKKIFTARPKAPQTRAAKIDRREYYWSSEVARGLKKSRRSMVATLAVHAIAVALMFFFAVQHDASSEGYVAEMQQDEFALPPAPNIEGMPEHWPIGDSNNFEFNGAPDFAPPTDEPIGLGDGRIIDIRPSDDTERPDDTIDVLPEAHFDADNLPRHASRTDVAGYFRLRGLSKQAKVKYLGSIELYDALDGALAYLQRRQEVDGSWGFVGVNKLMIPRSKEARQIAKIEMTSAALLAFLGDGHTSESSPARYDFSVRRGIDWLITQQNEGGQIGPAAQGNVLIHAMATLALVEDFGLTRNHRLRAPLRKACRWLSNVHAVDNSGGFPWKIGQGAGMVTTVWAYMALTTARNVKVPPIDLPQKRIDELLEWYERCTRKGKVQKFEAVLLARTDVLPQSAVGALSLFAHENGYELRGKKALRVINSNKPDISQDTKDDRCDFRYLFFASMSQALGSQRGNSVNVEWNKAFTKTVLDSRIKEGKEDGSYQPIAEYDSIYGKVLSTAYAALSIENPYRISLLK